MSVMERFLYVNKLYDCATFRELQLKYGEEIYVSHNSAMAVLMKVSKEAKKYNFNLWEALDFYVFDNEFIALWNLKNVD